MQMFVAFAQTLLGQTLRIRNLAYSSVTMTWPNGSFCNGQGLPTPNTRLPADAWPMC